MLGNYSSLSSSNINQNNNNNFNGGSKQNYPFTGSSGFNKAASYLDSIPEHPNTSSNSTSTSSSAAHSTCSSFPNSIGEYGMGKLLGRGAFGSVYEVTEIRHKTPLNDFRYAIKIMEKRSIKNEEMARRVRNEVALHRKLRHPNILNLYHFFEDDDRVYLVMELCGKGEIYSLLRRRRQDNGDEAGVLSESEARGILRDVVGGLKFLHSRGIIHRDLKLSNILLSEGGEAKIADFGLAVCTESTIDSSDSQERTICGTPNYLAPEILNKLNYGRGADIWSLGCLLYSFLTGKPPFDSPDLKETFARVKNLDYRIPESVSPAASDLISRLLSKDPSTRPTFDQIIWHPFFNPAVSEPLRTLRLAPLKQTTKYGYVEILEDGRVSVDFLDASDVFLVSGDGLSIELIDKRTRTSRMTPSTNIANLPTSLKRRYEYARRFVNLVKSKTPLIALSCRFRAFLTESGDFYMNFRDEASRRAEYCWVSRQLRIYNNSSTPVADVTINDPSPLALSEIDTLSHRQILLEFLARYRQCIQIRNSILHPDGTLRSRYHQSTMKFPVVIREGESTTGNASSMSLGLRSLSTDQQFNDSVSYAPNTFAYNGAYNMHTTNSHSNTNTNTHNNTHNNTQINTHSSSFSFIRKYLPSVGWCLSSRSPNSTHDEDQGVFLVLFNDGRAIQIDGHADTVHDLQTDRILPINPHLPPDIKDLLGLFSKFL